MTWIWTPPQLHRLISRGEAEVQGEESEEQMAKLGLLLELLELLERRGEVYSQGGQQDDEINKIIDFICTK